MVFGEGAGHVAHMGTETVVTSGTIEPSADGWVVQIVELWEGEYVSGALCTDDIDIAPEIERIWEGAGGSYTMTATPNGEDLTDVVLELQEVELSLSDATEGSVIMNDITMEASLGSSIGG